MECRYSLNGCVSSVFGISHLSTVFETALSYLLSLVLNVNKLPEVQEESETSKICLYCLLSTRFRYTQGISVNYCFYLLLVFTIAVQYH